MKRSTYTYLATFLALVLFVAANVAVTRGLPGAKIDLTEGRLYTLSESARKLLGRIVEPVELEFVYSRTAAGAYPGVQAHATRVRELLREIEAAADGKVVITETNPEPFSADEDRVALAGLEPLQSDGDPLFLGVLGSNLVDDVIVIPFLPPSRDPFLEYDLIRLIAQLDDPAPPVVALVSGLPGFRGDGSGANDALILREIARNFQVRSLAPDFDALPDDADILMLVAPLVLDEPRQKMIEDFLQTKGRAFIALDPAPVVAAATGARSSSAGLGVVTDMLGLSLATGVAADPALALPVEVPSGGGRTSVVGQPAFIEAPVALMAREDPVTGDLDRPINLGAAGALEFGAATGLQFLTLLETTDQAQTVAADLALQGADPRAISEAMRPPVGTRILAARVSGPIRANRNTELSLADIDTPAPADASVIVVADSDFLSDGFHIDPATRSPVAANAAFVLNALDNLAGGSALGELRSRAPAARPMTRIEEMRRQAEAEIFEEQRALESRLADFEARLSELESTRAESFGSTRMVDASSDQEVMELREGIMATRSQLREIERGYRTDIERLRGTIIAINVWLLPALVAFAGLGIYVWRTRSRRAAS